MKEVKEQPIGIFDSGLGGLIAMRHIVAKLPQYDFVYLGDSARVPYGTRSPKTVYEFTREGVDFLFRHGCQLVILACNTASARNGLTTMVSCFMTAVTA